MSHSHALLLNADYQPIKVISWKRAMSLVLEEKASLVIEYVGEVVRSVSRVFGRPAVVRLNTYRRPKGRLRYCPPNVLARDDYRCAYCDARGPGVKLTLDHVVPRAQARNGQVVLPWNGKRVPVTCWENVITACYDCNALKADRTPAQAKMPLRSNPRTPTALDMLRMSLNRMRIPAEWVDFLPDGSERTYWTAELGA